MKEKRNFFLVDRSDGQDDDDGDGGADERSAARRGDQNANGRRGTTAGCQQTITDVRTGIIRICLPLG